MLLKFGVENFYCFKDLTEVDFTFNRSVPESHRHNRDYSTVIGIKGANGSGKTNLIKALEFLHVFCVSSVNAKNEDEIPIDTFFDINNESYFYVDFKSNSNIYKYELKVTPQRVIFEKLTRNNKRSTPLIERVNNDIVYCINELNEFKKIKLKYNASILSYFDSFKFNKSISDIENAYVFFDLIRSNVNYYGLYRPNLSISNICEYYDKNPDVFSKCKDVLKIADEGISNVEVRSTIDDEDKKIFYPVFIRKHEKKSFEIHFSHESKGTQEIFMNIHRYVYCLSTGGILALDEFDIHLHSLILPYIISIFEDNNSNSKGSQFIFTAHNTEIIDALGKYRTILVNKEDNESYAYRLDEIPGSIIRNDRPISPLYLSRKIGGVPTAHEL